MAQGRGCSFDTSSKTGKQNLLLSVVKMTMRNKCLYKNSTHYTKWVLQVKEPTGSLLFVKPLIHVHYGTGNLVVFRQLLSLYCLSCNGS